MFWASLAPLFVMIALCIFVGDPGQLLFGHQRLGRGGARFPRLKLRMMVVDAGQRPSELPMSGRTAHSAWESARKLRRNPGVSAAGAFPGKAGFDELPHPFDMLRNGMSLAGRRPIGPAESPRHGCLIGEDASVLSRITGLWQVSGPNDISCAERVTPDVAFVGSCSTRPCLRIALATVSVAPCSRGSY